MAHFAKINNNNMVTEIIVIDNNDITVNGIESEKAGQEFIANVLGLDGRWVQTSYNGKFRNHYAGIGDFYDEATDKFLALEEKSVWTSQMPTTYVKDETKKTVLVDGFPRSGTVYLSYLLAHAFPETNQFTGYGSFHDLNSISVGKDKADAVFITVRKPIDSLRSLVNFRQVDKNDNDLLFRIALSNLDWMKKIEENKDKIFVVNFEKLTNDFAGTIAFASKAIRNLPTSITEEEIKASMIADNLELNLPNDTTAGELEINNSLVSAILDEATAIYNKIIS